MECCGREVVSFELKVAGQPFVLYRCGQCETSHWVLDDEEVGPGAVTGALRADTRERAEQRARRTE